MASITINYEAEGVDWPPIQDILGALGIDYDEDDSIAKAPNEDVFRLTTYPRAGYIRCDTVDDDEIPEAIFVLITHLPAPKGVRVLIQEDDFDEGISMSLSDFIESIMEDE